MIKDIDIFFKFNLKLKIENETKIINIYYNSFD